jgi:hypothetical protein
MTFATLLTNDGSPTVLLGHEPMHNLQGALGETVYVYGEALKLAFQISLSPRFLVVGLGLAYIEWVIIAEAYRHNADPKILTFESNVFLRGEFENFLKTCESKLFSGSRQVVERHYGVSLKKPAQAVYQNGGLKIEGELQNETEFADRHSVIFYDPFSQKTNPELWTEEFLTAFISKAASPCCVFATYASTGPLKRALKLNGFETIERKGFGRKRECTLAIRG